MAVEIEKESYKELGIQKNEILYPPSFKTQLKELFTPKWISFLFIPGKKVKELEEKKFHLYKYESKRSLIKNLLKSPLTIIGLFSVLTVVSWAVFANWIASFDFGVSNGLFTNDFLAPGGDYILGTGKFGRDVYSRLIWGARTSLTVGLAAILISLTLGVIFGLMAAYFGGKVDWVIMRAVDIIMSLPGLVMALLFVQILGINMPNIMLAYGLLGIPGYTRLMRGAALQEINKPYIHAARVSGASNRRILFKHLLPNCFAPVLVSFTFDIGGIILSLAGLSFLGFADPDLIEWGNDISAARGELYRAPWATFWPGLGILVTVLGFMLLGDGLRDALDPRTQK